MPAANEKKCTQKTNMESANVNGIIKVDEINTIQDNIRKNLDFFQKKLGLSDDKDMARKLGVTAPVYSRIKTGKQLPSLDPFLVTLHKNKGVFHCTIDDFLFTDLSEKEDPYSIDLPTAIYMKYEGLYQVYYFDTSPYKGQEFTEDADALKSGLMYIYHDGEEGEVKVYNAIAVLNMKKEDADERYAEIMRRQWRGVDIKGYIADLGGSTHVYRGKLELSEKHVFISLSYENLRDKAQMIFHRPSGNSDEYIGGLGMLISVSKGNGASPCVQCVALSKGSLDVSSEELASHLLMDYPKIQAGKEIEKLADMAVQLYSRGNDPELPLSEVHKKMIVQSEIDKIINDVVARNLFRMEMVTEEDDNKFYHYLKRVMKASMRQEG